MEKTLECKLAVLWATADPWHKWGIRFDTSRYNSDTSLGELFCDISYNSSVYNYKMFSDIQENIFYDKEKINKHITQTYYIGCDECVFKHKYKISGKCDKLFSLNNYRISNYSSKRKKELENTSEAIRQLVGNNFFKNG